MVFQKGAAMSIAVAMVVLSAENAFSQSRVRIEVQNNQPADGFFFTPVWFGLHDGSFDYFDVGGSASPSTELLAEGGVLDDGMGNGIINDFAAAQPSGSQGVAVGPSGFGSSAGQPPVFDPGEIAEFDLVIGDPTVNRYLSFGSMLIPSNDAFIGNDDGQEYEVFDAAGNFNGPFTINIFGDELWDAGTETNDGLGAPFSTNGGTSTPEALLVRQHPDGLAIFVGTGTAAGTTIGQAIGLGDPIASFSVSAIPEPASGLLAFLGLAGAAFLRRKRVN